MYFIFLMLQVLREGFIPHEATCVGLEVNKDPLAAEEMLELCADAALDGLSLVAIATDTGEVVATVFCKLQVGNIQINCFYSPDVPQNIYYERGHIKIFGWCTLV